MTPSTWWVCAHTLRSRRRLTAVRAHQFALLLLPSDALTLVSLQAYMLKYDSTHGRFAGEARPSLPA